MSHTSCFCCCACPCCCCPIRFRSRARPDASTASGALGDSPLADALESIGPSPTHSPIRSFTSFVFIQLIHSNTTTPLAATSKVRQRYTPTQLAQWQRPVRLSVPPSASSPVERRRWLRDCSHRDARATRADDNSLTHSHTDIRRQARQRSESSAVHSTTATGSSTSLIQPPSHVSPSPSVCLPFPLPLRFRPRPPFRCAAPPSSSSPHRRC